MVGVMARAWPTSRNDAEQVFGIENAAHVINGLAIERRAAMSLLQHHLYGLIEGCLFINRDDIDTRNHHLVQL
jgi:hypothetical protein